MTRLLGRHYWRVNGIYTKFWGVGENGCIPLGNLIFNFYLIFIEQNNLSSRQ